MITRLLQKRQEKDFDVLMSSKKSVMKERVEKYCLNSLHMGKTPWEKKLPFSFVKTDKTEMQIHKKMIF